MFDHCGGVPKRERLRNFLNEPVLAEEEAVDLREKSNGRSARLGFAALWQSMHGTEGGEILLRLGNSCGHGPRSQTSNLTTILWPQAKGNKETLHILYNSRSMDVCKRVEIVLEDQPSPFSCWPATREEYSLVVLEKDHVELQAGW